MNRLSLSLFVLVSLLFSMGLIMVFNTTTAEALDRQNISIYFPFLKQLIYGVGGAFLAWLLYRSGYENLLKWSPKLLLIFFFFLLLVFVPGIGQQINGARRWIGLRILSFQPSEFVKMILPFFCIHFILQKKMHLTIKQFALLTAISGTVIFTILLEPDNGTAAILIVTLVALFFLTRIKALYWALPFALIILIGGGIASQMKHVPDRIRIYLNPELDLLGKGHQPYQAKIAAGSGKLLGRGLGESLQKLNYLPEARSDYIAAIYAEEFGFVGIVFLIILYMALTLIGVQIALSCNDLKGYYVAGIITFVISLQAFLNLGVVSGLLPSKGTNLPFFSQGGSSLIVNLLMVAMMINVSEKRRVYA